MDPDEVIKFLGRDAEGAKITAPRRVTATTDIARLRKVLERLVKGELHYLCTISGVDRGERIEVIYHLDCNPTVLNLKISVPKENPRVPTITDLIPGAVLYERDLMEMLGVKVEGHPDPRRLFLPEDWPEGAYPLRKEVKK